jgi:signal transduction histidine kinase
MLAQSLIYLPSIVGVFAIAWFVAFRSRRPVFRFYGVFSAFVALWLICQYLTDVGVGSGLLWLRAAAALAFPLGIMFVLFIYTYPDNPMPGRRFRWLLYIPAALLAPLSFTPLVVKDVSYTDAGGVVFVAGPLFDIQTVVTIAYVLLGIGILFAKGLHASASHRNQIKLLTAAFAICLLGNVLAGFVYADNPYWQFARPLSILAMLLIIAYAMAFRGLFDIRVYVVRAVVYSMALSLSAVVFVLLTMLTTTYIVQVPLEVEGMVAISAITMVVAVIFHPLRKLFNRFTNRVFFRDHYEPQDILDRISDLLVRTADVQKIQEGSTQILQDTIRPTFVQFMLLADAKGGSKRTVELLLETKQNVLVTDELDHVAQHDAYATLKKLDVAIAVRLRTSQNDLGFLTLGYRHSGANYTQAEHRLLGVVADEVAFSLQNAIHLKEIEQFNVKLQREIKDATQKLQHSNDHLRMLDQTKDDFISMASHQLRTPLTSIKGYVSMVLEGDAGNVSPLQKKLLAQAFVSSQRMVYLISDLLNVSRLRTGKFVVETSPTHLASIAREEVSQLQETAKSRGIELTVKHTDHFPALMLDETKMRQVVMNFIDNAIYYTPEGGHISVNVVERPRSIELTVVDDGMGVPKVDQPHLFSKFFRANNAKRARPDGTGLGLFMAKKVVMAQGGAIIFRSTEGKGSTFGFTFSKDKVTVVKNYKPAQSTPASLLHKPKSAIMS